MSAIPVRPNTVDLQHFIPSPQATECIDEACARRLQVVPVAIERTDFERCLLVAVSSLDDFTQQERLRKHVDRSVELKWLVAIPNQIPAAIDRCYNLKLSAETLLNSCQRDDLVKGAARENEHFYIRLLD